MNQQHIQLKIEGIECSAIIGCCDYELNNYQPVLVNLEIFLKPRAYNDDISQTLDYNKVCDYTQELVHKSHYQLVESLAIYLANQFLIDYQLISHIKVTLNKPNINGKKARYIECSYSKSRNYKVALALGSNIHNPPQQLITAIGLLSEFISEIKTASFYKSAPQGFTDQDDFFNTCISGYTALSPELLLSKIKQIEKIMGKMEQFINGPRIIDIDILLFETEIHQGQFLTIPHKRMTERDFVLLPLAEIEADWMHPASNLSIKQLVSKLAPDNRFIIEKVQL